MEYGSSLDVEILERSKSNRIVSLKINDVVFTGREVYSKLGLRSYDFEFVLVGNNVEINAKGYGHGVGMSQEGANAMAKSGATCEEIIKYYYSGVEVFEQ